MENAQKINFNAYKFSSVDTITIIFTNEKMGSEDQACKAAIKISLLEIKAKNCDKTANEVNNEIITMDAILENLFTAQMGIEEFLCRSVLEAQIAQLINPSCDLTIHADKNIISVPNHPYKKNTNLSIY